MKIKKQSEERNMNITQMIINSEIKSSKFELETSLLFNMSKNLINQVRNIEFAKPTKCLKTFFENKEKKSVSTTDSELDRGFQRFESIEIEFSESKAKKIFELFQNYLEFFIRDKFFQDKNQLKNFELKFSENLKKISEKIFLLKNQKIEQVTTSLIIQTIKNENLSLKSSLKILKKTCKNSKISLSNVRRTKCYGIIKKILHTKKAEKITIEVF